MTLNAIIKRHVTILSELQSKGEHGVYQVLHEYIRDAARQGLVVPENAQEIYETWVDNSGRPSYSNNDYKVSYSYEQQIRKLKHTIEDGIDATHADGE